MITASAYRARGVRQLRAALILCVLSVLGLAASAQAAYVGATDSASPSTITNGAATTYTVGLEGTTVATTTPTDVMLVFDESGSIAPADFTRMKTFARDVVTSLETKGVFANGGKVGVAFFSTNARTIIAPDASPGTVRTAIANASQQGGNTCIGCGVQLAHNLLTQHSAPDHKKVSVVLTDGLNNINLQQFPTVVANAKAAGIEHFAIGVGSAPDQNQLRLVASEPDSTHVFQVAQFSALDAILAQLTAAVVEPAETDITWTFDVAGDFDPSGATVDKGTVSVSGNEVTWTIPALAAETATLSFTATHRTASGCGAKHVVASTTYSSAQGSAAPAIDRGPVEVVGCDVTAPEIAIDSPADGETYGIGTPLHADYACTDEAGGSGLDTCVGDLTDGSALDTMTVGEQSFTVVATDKAGNRATKTVTYTVRVTPDSLCALTRRYIAESAKYGSAKNKQSADSLAAVACKHLGADGDKAARLYRTSLKPLTVQDWLTPEQAATLAGLADEL